MVNKNYGSAASSEKTGSLVSNSDFTTFTKTLKDFAITVDEPCPEGHRRDPKSGACLPIEGMDHTAFTRSLNDEQGPLWRGEEDKTNQTFSSKEEALDANDMDEPESCTEGMTFSFVKRICISLEDAAAEDSDDLSDAAEALTPKEEPRMKQPEGRRDTPNHQCPPGEFFDYKLRACIPLNKDTLLKGSESSPESAPSSMGNSAGEGGAHAHYDGVARTSPDPTNGHMHKAIVDSEGNGLTTTDDYPSHNHVIKGYKVLDWESTSGDYVSRHFEMVNPHACGEPEVYDQVPSIGISSSAELAEKITTKTRNALPSSSFGVPEKRKFPLDTCARVRNAMARFNQAKGLSSSEKAALRRKILARAKACGIKVDNFSKATTIEEFAEVFREMRMMEAPTMHDERDVVLEYSREEEAKKKMGPCPPGMEWDAKAKKCGKMMGFFKHITQADALKSDERPEAKQPEGRRDTPNHQCPPGEFFDYKNRKCVGLNPASKVPGTTTEQADESAAQRDLAPSPKGRPAKISQDCPPGTIWRQVTQTCIPLDSQKKTKSSQEEGGAKNREGLVPAPEGKVKIPSDCPEGHLWDGILKACRPLDSRKKTRPGNQDMDPKDLAGLSINKLISELDKLISSEDLKAIATKTSAKGLPNSAFPPSLVSATKRSLMHHSPEVSDPYDNASVDLVRLRNALARIGTVQDFPSKAVADALEHLLYHAREVLQAKKA